MSTPTNRREVTSVPASVSSNIATTDQPTSATSLESVAVSVDEQHPELSTSSSYSKEAKQDHPLFQALNQQLDRIPLLQQWKSRRAFLVAQGQVIGILLVAFCINNWPVSYPREENHNEPLFWIMTLALCGATFATLKQEPSNRRVQLLSRAQTEEWKGWMQFIFIMYHYYRNRTIYNEIRVLVSAYVWMTGFGHFLYCDKKQDFSLERMVSMWVRINYFPLMLSVCLGVPLELYYVVPLHTAGFFMALGTCYIAKILRDKQLVAGGDATKSNAAAIGISLLVHVIFFETSLHTQVLGMFSHEYIFRFSTDKYSAWVGVLSGFLWSRFQSYMQWCYGEEEEADGAAISLDAQSPQNKTSKPLRGQSPRKVQAMYLQRAGGVALLLAWYYGFGTETDKHKYNPQHSYVFWMPVAGWLMVRNSSKYLTELHSTILEWMGRITLETYVLQFHVFMCRNVQHIPVMIPGSGANGFAILKFINMLVTGVAFLALAWYARRATVMTQNAITELVTDIRQQYFGSGSTDNSLLMKTKPTLGIIQDESEETKPLTEEAKNKKDEEA